MIDAVIEQNIACALDFDRPKQAIMRIFGPVCTPHTEVLELVGTRYLVQVHMPNLDLGTWDTSTGTRVLQVNLLRGFADSENFYGLNSLKSGVRKRFWTAAMPKAKLRPFQLE